MSRRPPFTWSNLSELIHGFHSSEASPSGFSSVVGKWGRVSSLFSCLFSTTPCYVLKIKWSLRCSHCIMSLKGKRCAINRLFVKYGQVWHYPYIRLRHISILILFFIFCIIKNTFLVAAALFLLWFLSKLIPDPWSDLLNESRLPLSKEWQIHICAVWGNVWCKSDRETWSRPIVQRHCHSSEIPLFCWTK